MNNPALTILRQEQPVAFLKSDSMPWKKSRLSASLSFPEAMMEKVALLEYLSSGLNRAGCADFVTSPAWTCSEDTAC